MAISNHRIAEIDTDSVAFNYKDYRHGGKQQVLRLGHGEFIRRFAMHILPRGFVRIRHYGILSSSSRIKSLNAIREQLPKQWEPSPPEHLQLEPVLRGTCPQCKTATMITVETLPKRGPPALILSSEDFKNNH